MAGLYLHIPFCKTKCHYCNFFSLASLKFKDQILLALLKEISLKKNLVNEEIESIYFGGGTPSILQPLEIQTIITEISKCYKISTLTEITLEANPEDVIPQNLSIWKNAGVNRLSLGLQSLNDDILKKLNRNHTGTQSLIAVKNAIEYGFENLSVDLIFGIPGQTDFMLQNDLELMTDLQIPHISAYNLTIEKKTALDFLIKKNKYPIPDEIQGAEQFYRVSDFLQSKGFEHYEISNFAKKGQYSLHNTNYWRQRDYLGFGPSAHSYYHYQRSWNPSSIKDYLQQIDEKKLFLESENIDELTRLNEYLMLGIRTQWGIDLKLISMQFPQYYDSLILKVQKLMEKEFVQTINTNISLTRKGKLMADTVALELFF